MPDRVIQRMGRARADAVPLRNLRDFRANRLS
jgi:hypothetical protein